MEILQSLAREQQRAVVVVTHDNRILDFADRTVHMEDGMVTQS
jgi:putative ABC transport system ATP-binding protein